jgi:integrase
MRGYIRKRGNTYLITVSAGFDSVTGKRQQVYRTARTKGEAERELTELLRAIDSGTFADPGKITVAAYLLDRWLPHQETRLRPRTWDRYRQLLTLHVLPRVGSVKLAKLRPAHVQHVIDSMLLAGLAPRTVLQGYRILSSALRQAVRWQLLSGNPAAAASPPRPERADLTIPTTEEVGRLLQEAEGSIFHVPLVLSATTGMRRGEVLALRWPAVDLEAGLIRVVASLQRVRGELRTVEPKTDRARRAIALPPVTVAVLRRQRKEQTERRLLLGEAWQDLGFVVDRGDGQPLDPGHYSHVFVRLARRAGLPGVRLHDLRHGFATALLAAGIHPKVASEALGHASVGFTLDAYSHVLPGMQEQAARAIEAALRAAITGDAE